MKLSWTALLAAAAVAATVQGQEKPALKDLKEKASYSIGLNIGGSMRKQGVEINLEALAAGIKDALSGAKAQLSDEEIQKTMLAFQQGMAAKGAERGEKAKKGGEDFLTENKKKEGVKTTASGLQYKVIKAGTGKVPKAEDSVTTHYRGTLIDGTEFDNSYKRNEPVTFDVTGVIKGWTEALQLMPTGSKWQLYIPSALAYGERGTPDGSIPPNSTLIFDIELLSIAEPKKPN